MNVNTARQHRSPEQKAHAVTAVEDLVKSGESVRSAIEQVGNRTGFSARSLFRFLEKTKGVSIAEREDALTSIKPRAPRPKAPCHPEALAMFMALGRQGKPVVECYRQMKAKAEVFGWTPIPSERTLSRELNRQISASDRFTASRSSKPMGGLHNV